MARVFRRDESWWLDYFYEGRRYRQKIGAKRKAEDALAIVRSKIAAGDFVPPDQRKREGASERASEATFHDFARDDYLPWSEANHSVRHHELQESIIRVQLTPYFKDQSLDEITPKLVDDYVTRRRRGIVPWSKKRRQVKEATVNRDIACLKILFRKAVEWGKIEDSPAKGLKSFKEIPNPPRLLEGDEITRLLEELPHRLKALIGCAVYAGLRKQKLFYLRREDVNLKMGELSVVSRREHHTKNYKTRRIPINEALADLLRSHPRRLGSPYLFCNKEENPYDNVKTAMQSAAQRAGIEGGVGLHQLRHAFCSHSLMQGIDARTVQKWMGHRDLATTLGYAHVSPEHEKAAIQRLRYDTWHQDGTKVEGT